MENKIIYQLKKKTLKNEEDIHQLIESGVHPVMAELYSLRGINNFKNINLVQKLEPFKNIKNIELAADILMKAILKKEKICVVADYDVDGATACTIAMRGLKMFGAHIDYIVPNRFVHGYGLTPSVVEEAIQKKNPDLIITVDNGISSHDGVDYAHKKGLKVLVTDHHLPGDTLPNADCIVNPNQKGCSFQSKSMAGCGVMFYVLAALREHSIQLGIYSNKIAPNVFSLLDLVAIGTIADVVKLDLNNRIMVKIGLDLIRNKKTREGILALITVAKRKYEFLTTTDIAFGLAPRINAAGRLEDMTIGINCLLTDNKQTAEKLANQLNEINKNRKDLETEMKEQVLILPDLVNSRYTKVAYDESFHEGVIGIVASRVKEMFYKPTIVFAPSQEEGLIKGSGRSIPEVHLRDVLDYIYKKDFSIIKKFGGHAMAAGLTIDKEKLQDFVHLFEEAVCYFSDGKEFKNIKEIDMNLSEDFINLETAEKIRDEIWGQGFPSPLFFGNFEIIEQKILKESHLKLILKKENNIYEAIWFFNNQMIEDKNCNLIYTLGINEFLGKKNIQLLIDGIF